MRLSEIVCYSYEDLTTFTVVLNEADSDWIVKETNAYKQGVRRHQYDARVIDPLKELIDFILSHENVPKYGTYPPKLNVHSLAGQYKGYHDAHLRGQRIIAVFKIIPGEKNPKPDPEKPETKWKSKNILELVHVGTHQELGWKG